ncbi:hydrogenase maturation nickel metallochaperone HypA [bacterium]|nr:hydrogenase maturation nickel metallochaperone HypA [bacterium]
MHELSLVQGLCGQLDELARQHGACRVRELTVEVGVLSNVVPELLRQAFLAIRPQLPLLREAELTLREVPLTVVCRDCGRATDVSEPRFRCPACDSPRVTASGGEELLLRDVSLEIEENGNERDPSHRGEGEPSQVQ